MPRFLRSLPAVVLAAGLLTASLGTAQAPPRDLMTQAQAQANALAKSLRILREDIDVDLPDARGANLGAIVDRCVFQVRNLQRATRSNVPPAQLHKMTVELDKELDRLVAGTASLGSDGYYLRKLANQINAQNEHLAQLLSPPTISPRVFALTDQIAKGLRALRDDIDIDLPDARGKALDSVADRCLLQIRPLYRGARFGASPAQLQRHVVEMDKDLAKLLDMTAALGPDGYYLRKSTANLHALCHELLRSLNPPRTP